MITFAIGRYIGTSWSIIRRSSWHDGIRRRYDLAAGSSSVLTLVFGWAGCSGSTASVTSPAELGAVHHYHWSGLPLVLAGLCGDDPIMFPF